MDKIKENERRTQSANRIIIEELRKINRIQDRQVLLLILLLFSSLPPAIVPIVQELGVGFENNPVPRITQPTNNQPIKNRG